MSASGRKLRLQFAHTQLEVVISFDVKHRHIQFVTNLGSASLNTVNSFQAFSAILHGHALTAGHLYSSPVCNGLRTYAN